MNYYERALQLKDGLIADRRYLHANAEVGLILPLTKAYVMQKLTEHGLEPIDCGYGITTTVGKEGKCILLRADMDALPMGDESGESFACPTGTEAHCCGHDMHTAMLLTAARMLKENEDALEGKVKLMFQPAEETFEGCQHMIENDILENPTPDAALAFHVGPGQMPVGLYMYNSTGTMMNSVDGFKIVIQGRGAHGGYPHTSIDPINIAVHIYLALEALIAREADPSKSCVMTVGRFDAGTAPNIIPETALLEGTIRTNDKAARELLVLRMREVAVRTAEVYGGSAEVIILYAVSPLICDSKLTDEIAGYLKELGNPGAMGYPGISASASEDFASIAEKIPSAYFYLSAGFTDARGTAAAHNPKVMFNEDVLPVGAAGYAHCATKWLQNNK